jgi:hypothetical protein
MRLNILIINIIIFVFAGILHSQNVREDVLITNLDVYSMLTDKNLEVMGDQFVILGKDKIYSTSIVARPDIKDYLYLKIKQRLSNFRIISESDSSASDFFVKFEDVKFVTKYKKIFGSVLKNRKVQRQIEISYKYEIKNRDSILYGKDISDVNNDEFYFDKFNAVERGNYSFLTGVLPEQSFLEKALIPGLVVLTSAVAIVLFFVIRSK